MIAKLDSGHRGSVLSVTELMVLAAALDIPPGVLLYPGYPTAHVELLPGLTTATYVALLWFSGEMPLPDQRDPEGSQRFRPRNGGTELVRLVHQYHDNADFLQELRVRWQKKDSVADRELLQRQMDDLKDRLAELKDEIDELSRDFAITEKPR
jgi:hypothetical protein